MTKILNLLLKKKVERLFSDIVLQLTETKNYSSYQFEHRYMEK